MTTINSSSGNQASTVDCLLIGHYEMDCQRNLENVKRTGTSDEVWRELSFSVLYHQDKPYYGSDILNLFCREAMNTPGEFYQHWGGMSLAIAYLGTYLTRRGYSFDFINSFQAQRNELAEKLKKENILLIAITTTYYVTYLPILEILRFIRSHNRTAKIVVGGPFVHNQVFSITSKEALKALFEILDADFYINSAQGEAALVKVIQALKDKTTMDGIDNLYYKNGSGYASTPQQLEENRLADNLVDWQLMAGQQPEYVNVRTAISCPFKCAFCGFRVRAGKYQRLEVEQIETELNRLNRIESVKTVQFIDDTLNTPTQRFRDLLRMLIKNKYRFKWISWLRCDNIDEEIAQLMKESGCLGVLMGFESGSNLMLKNMNKGVTVEKYLKGVEDLKRAGILTYGSFIFGFPGETAQTVADTCRFIENCGIDFYGTKIWFVEPFSAIMAEKEKFRISGSQYNWSHISMNSKQAIEIKEKAFLEIKHAIPMPDIQFHFQNVLHLVNKGMRIETLKSFVNHFNQGLTERLTGKSHNISSKVAEALRRDSCTAFRECNGREIPLPQADKAGNLAQTLKGVDFEL